MTKLNKKERATLLSEIMESNEKEYIYDPKRLQKAIDKARPNLSNIENIDNHVAFTKGYDVEEEAAWREAKRLIEVFFGETIPEFPIDETILLRLGKAKENAIKCCDEIIKSWQQDGNKRLDKGITEYWESVKKQIKDILEDNEKNVLKQNL